MSPRVGLGFLAAALAISALVGCDSTAQIVVLANTDYPVPSGLDQIRVQVDATATGVAGVTERTMELESASDSLPVTLGLVHAGGAYGPIEVTVTGRRGGRDRLSRRARVWFAPGETRVLRLALLRACEGVICGPEETCGETGCVSIEPPLEPWPPPPQDGGTACGTERCNGMDDDCDGVTDEGFDQLTDPANCGSCGTVCGGSESCQSGRCAPACPDGFGECDGDPSTVCETPLSTEADCGACGRACVRFSGITSCEGGECRLLACQPGFRDCDINPDNGCESDLADTSNCGGCGIPCELFEATEACLAGTCSILSCSPGFDNCDGRTENGCESAVSDDVFHCGGCDRRCATVAPHASNVCNGGRCEFACHPGWADCDGIAETGCETDISLPMNCGSCGNRCTGIDFLCSGTASSGFACIPPPCTNPPTRCGATCVDLDTNANHCGACDFTCPGGANAAPTCTGAACGINCDVGYGDCDLDLLNGCETPLNLVLSCGTCGFLCDLPQAVEVCIGGACAITACDAGWADCNLDPRDGCERSTTTLTDCGGCGTACALPNAVPSCATGVCQVQACQPGWGNCDGVDANGCEQPLSGCATCGGTCVFDHALASCVSGACQLDACDSGWGSCDGLLENGCERSLTTLTDCGACDDACALDHATESCASGACDVAACEVGWGDCDASAATGCETNLEVSAAHCGVCARACAPTESCSAGTCQSSNAPIGVAAGRRHTCTVLASGAVWCWGDNDTGELGDGTFFSSPRPVRTIGISDAVEVAAGRSSTCARHASGTVSCWGGNVFGQLGVPGGSRAAPVLVPGITNAVALSVFGEFACALLATGQVSCWGDNRSAQMGRGFASFSEIAGLVSGVIDAVSVATGSDHACIVRAGGQVHCWGENSDGQLGDGSTTDSTLPLASAIGGVVAVAAGDAHTCARLATGAVRCWGANLRGQLGDGTVVASRLPRPVLALSDAVQLSTGDAHSCVARTTSAVECWGQNGGALGDGTILNRSAPVRVTGLSATRVAAGSGHSCAVTGAGTVMCWGANNRGQLGDGLTLTSLLPVSVVGLP